MIAKLHSCPGIRPFSTARRVPTFPCSLTPGLSKETN